MLETAFTRLVGCSVPLQQAALGPLSGPELAAAVADAGALGMTSGVLVPRSTLVRMLDGLRERTGGRFGVNWVSPFVDVDCVEAAAERADVVEFFYGDPDRELVARVKERGALVSWQVGSRREALAAATAGCDLIVAQGVEAGGHVRGRIGLFPLLAEILDEVEVPVLAAGGIGTARSVAAALAAGAAGVRVGTRFVAALETESHPEHVAALVEASAEDTVLSEAFSHMWPHAPHRVLRSALAAAEAFEGEVVGEIRMAGGWEPLARLDMRNPTRETRGEIRAMALYAGESVAAVKRRQPAAAIVAELAEGAEALLRALSRVASPA